MAEKRVSEILRKLADMMDSGDVVNSRLHVVAVGPVMIEVNRISDKEPAYVIVGAPGNLQRFSFSCELTTDMASVRSVMER